MIIKKNEMTDKIIKELDEGIKNFGLYSLLDKGAYEIMNTSSLANELEFFPISEIREILLDVINNHEHGNEVVSALLQEFDSFMSDSDWEFLMEKEMLNSLY